jgi:hypothetical protein
MKFQSGTALELFNRHSFYANVETFSGKVQYIAVQLLSASNQFGSAALYWDDAAIG